MPKLSVLMLVYNHGLFLKQALDSVLMQKVNFDYDIVVGDDSSTDDSLSILIEYAVKYPGKIKLIKHAQNVGIYQNLQDVFQSCSGEYIAWLEGDDYWTSDSKIQQQIDFLDSHSDFNLCFHRVSVVNNADNKLVYNAPGKNYKTISTIDDLLNNNFIQTCSVVFRNGIIHEIPNWFQSLKLADWPLHILHTIDGKIAYLNQIMAVYRVHNKGVWSGNTIIYRNAEVIKMFESLRLNIDEKYSNKIQHTISKLYFDNARLSVDIADWTNYEKFFYEFVIRSNKESKEFKIKIFRLKIKFFLKKHFPLLHDFLKSCKNYLVKLIINLR